MMLLRCCIVQSFLSIACLLFVSFQLKALESFNLEYIYRNVIVNIPLLYPAGRAARLLYTDKAAFPPAEQRKTPSGGPAGSEIQSPGKLIYRMYVK